VSVSESKYGEYRVSESFNRSAMVGIYRRGSGERTRASTIEDDRSGSSDLTTACAEVGARARALVGYTSLSKISVVPLLIW